MDGWMMQEGEERGRRGIIRKGWARVDSGKAAGVRSLDSEGT